MTASCNSSRCTRCGRKKRQNETIFHIDDDEFVEEEIFDGIWSPMEPLRGKNTFSQGPSNSQDTKGRIIILDLANNDSEQSTFDSGHWRRKVSRHQTIRHKYMVGRRSFNLKRFMEDFARGITSAFGASASKRSRKIGRNLYGDEFELENLRASRFLLPTILPSRSRLRYLFNRMQAKPQPLSPE
jgi:hypothetical protein